MPVAIPANLLAAKSRTSKNTATGTQRSRSEVSDWEPTPWEHQTDKPFARPTGEIHNGEQWRQQTKNSDMSSSTRRQLMLISTCTASIIYDGRRMAQTLRKTAIRKGRGFVYAYDNCLYQQVKKHGNNCPHLSVSVRSAVVQSCCVHPCEAVRQCPVLQCPILRTRPSMSSPAISVNPWRVVLSHSFVPLDSVDLHFSYT